MGWSERSPLVRARLRNRALRYADHGWEVTPGACLSRGRFVCGRPGCPTIGCHPALERWEQAATRDPRQVAAWWQRHPHAVLLATGRAFDVLDVPTHLGLWVLGAARLHARIAGSDRGRVRGPVAVTPTGRWMFLVRPGDPLRPELADSLDVVRHGRGSWVPAPPTVLPEGPVRWVVAPEETRWQLPASYAVQDMVVDARTTSPRHLMTARAPRPLPRLHRA
ncbi:Bifunctional DNA primase/polymerase, N-terminal [Micromonospora pattaloongensis]|uniref:Bifunctional DNA primase/polymerase, N-terminal n=1 Tax=Micromonospora pattaloongensis TaxID=405436 RepID=A0A1H3PTM1_9ACTN|nr:bifunctional DNA primase/polymerase [Micromonospora pattaloongensis]SDZ04614.1 Bifunctional DNA primase/polymerase, N-terminal [Micromonospora pattaloongensis]